MEYPNHARNTGVVVALLFFMAVCTALLAGCGGKYSRIKPGMTEKQVVAILGQPPKVYNIEHDLDGGRVPIKCLAYPRLIGYFVIEIDMRNERVLTTALGFEFIDK